MVYALLYHLNLKFKIFNLNNKIDLFQMEKILILYRIDKYPIHVSKKYNPKLAIRKKVMSFIYIDHFFFIVLQKITSQNKICLIVSIHSAKIMYAILKTSRLIFGFLLLTRPRSKHNIKFGPFGKAVTRRAGWKISWNCD